MSNLIVDGGARLRGEIAPSANKNAVLPILCATLLTEEPVRIEGLPDISDIRGIAAFFRRLGSRIDVDYAAGTMDIHHKDLPRYDGSVPLPTGIRSSIMLAPPLLARFGYVRIGDDVKGCTLGSREIDPHVDVFRKFGASVVVGEHGVEIFLPHGFKAASHWFEYASVTATENFVMCAALAKGVSTLVNAACEPHVQEFSRFLASLGARIDGVGASRLTVTGVDALAGGVIRLTEDFHEITTFLALGAITGGEIKVKNSQPEHFPLIDRTFEKFGVEITHADGWSTVHAPARLTVAKPFTPYILPKIEAAPWPYLSVDLLPIFVALGVRSEGNVMYWNKVYEGAFGWTSELSKFGAHAVLCDPHRLIIFGGKPLAPATVESPYIIRVAISLLMIAASIEGTSRIVNAAPISRAHPRFAENITSLGAHVRWESDEA